MVTTRAGDMFRQKLAALIAEGAKPDLVVLSPGPGTPTDFDLKGTMAALQEHEIPAFGVCLGLQDMVETFGSTLGVLRGPIAFQSRATTRPGGALQTRCSTRISPHDACVSFPQTMSVSGTRKLIWRFQESVQEKIASGHTTRP